MRLYLDAAPVIYTNDHRLDRFSDIRYELVTDSRL